MSAVSSAKRDRKLNYMDRKIPESAKYSHVKAVVDSGASLNKYLAKVEEIKTNYRYKNDEIFKRMKVSTFAQLVLQVEYFKLNSEQANSITPISEIGENGDHVHNGGMGNGNGVREGAMELDTARSTVSTMSDRSTLQDVIRGIGEFELTHPGLSVGTPSELGGITIDTSPYLLLDVRDSDAYDQCRIIGAKNYPTAMLSRTMNSYTKDILAFMNKPGKIIVLYDEDERLANYAATTLVQRGIDNLFVLSGGLKVAAMKIPTGLITGKLPPACVTQSKSNKPRGKQPTTARSTTSTASEQPITQPITQTITQPITQQALKDSFTQDQLEDISGHMEMCLLPGDTGSRLSRMSTTSSRASDAGSVISARSSMSTASSTPWK